MFGLKPLFAPRLKMDVSVLQSGLSKLSISKPCHIPGAFWQYSVPLKMIFNFHGTALLWVHTHAQIIGHHDGANVPVDVLGVASQNRTPDIPPNVRFLSQQERGKISRRPPANPDMKCPKRHFGLCIVWTWMIRKLRGQCLIWTWWRWLHVYGGYNNFRSSNICLQLGWWLCILLQRW